MSKKLEIASTSVLDKELVDQNGSPLVKEDKTPLTAYDVILAALAINDSKHEDKLERWEAIKSIKKRDLKEEHVELIKKWVIKSVPSPVICGQILESI